MILPPLHVLLEIKIANRTTARVVVFLLGLEAPMVEAR